MSQCVLSSRSLHPITSCHLSPTASALSLPTATCSVVSPSESGLDRAALADLCSGCTHELSLHRLSILDDAVDFFKSIGFADFAFDSFKLWGWRCGAMLAFAVDRQILSVDSIKTPCIV
ncbi:hypothetical protein NL676_006280 [Syzygium grande]|nr:hypothetical protein NL676_006280 [Syzygium grande]